MNAKASKNAKVVQDDRTEVTAEAVEPDVDMEEFYDMEELLEHRIISEEGNFDTNYAELKMRLQHGNSAAKFHVENMSILQSRYLLQEYEKTIQKYAINDNDPLNVVYAKQRNEAIARENESYERKRLTVLTEIFRCLNEKVVTIPGITNELESLRNFSVTDNKNSVDRMFPSVAQRYAAYLVVAKRAKQLMNELVRGAEQELIDNAGIVAQLKRQHDVQILKDAHVVGKSNNTQNCFPQCNRK